MAFLVSIDGYPRHHIVIAENTQIYKFLCGKETRVSRCKELDRDELGVNTCIICLTGYYNNRRCDRKEDKIDIGTILVVPKAVSETGRIKIVADQTKAPPNNLQPGVETWDYKAIMYDPDYPQEYHPAFNVTKEEIDCWSRLYGEQK